MNTIKRGFDENGIKVLRIEGVPYYRHVMRFTLADGRQRRLVRWSPGHPWVHEEVGRELIDTYGEDGIRPGSCTIRLDPLQ
jgi:hypothetical protein